ncbi:MAG TPA: hypothetical protein VIY73_03005, partial [Polyangiaceae bacterium]
MRSIETGDTFSSGEVHSIEKKEQVVETKVRVIETKEHFVDQKVSSTDSTLVFRAGKEKVFSIACSFSRTIEQVISTNVHSFETKDTFSSGTDS